MEGNFQIGQLSMKRIITILTFFLALACESQVSSGGYILAAPDGTPIIANGKITNAMLATPPSAGTTVYARVTGNNATTTGQALTNITGLTIPLVANATYTFRAVLTVQSSSNTGIAFGVNFSAAGASVEALIYGTLTATSTRCDRINAFNVATPSYVTVAATGGVTIDGTVTTGANAGNLTIPFLKTTSGTATVFIHSRTEATRIL